MTFEDWEAMETVADVAFMLGQEQEKGNLEPRNSRDWIIVSMEIGINFHEENKDRDWAESEEDYIDVLGRHVLEELDRRKWWKTDIRKGRE